MKKAVLLAGIVSALTATPAQATPDRSSGEVASASAMWLTFGEARREIRTRFRRDARRDGDYDTYLETGGCSRYSARRVRCWVYYEYTSNDGYDFDCEGPMQVIEFSWGYRTQGKGIEC
jgi:hypothetical protein